MPKTQDLVFRLLDPDIFKSTEQVVHEFRAEYPEAWQELTRQGQEEYGPGCTAVQSPATVVRQALFALPLQKRRMKREGEQHFWSALLPRKERG